MGMGDKSVANPTLKGELTQLVNVSKLEEDLPAGAVYLTSVEREIILRVIDRLSTDDSLNQLYFDGKATNLQVENVVKGQIAYEDRIGGRTQVVYELSEDPTREEVLRACNVIYQVINRIDLK